MNVEIILKLFSLAILIIAVNAVLSKSGREEFCTMVTMAGIIIGMALVIREARYLYDYVVSTFGL